MNLPCLRQLPKILLLYLIFCSPFYNISYAQDSPKWDFIILGGGLLNQTEVDSVRGIHSLLSEDLNFTNPTGFYLGLRTGLPICCKKSEDWKDKVRFEFQAAWKLKNLKSKDSLGTLKLREFDFELMPMLSAYVIGKDKQIPLRIMGGIQLNINLQRTATLDSLGIDILKNRWKGIDRVSAKILGGLGITVFKVAEIEARLFYRVSDISNFGANGNIQLEWKPLEFRFGIGLNISNMNNT